MPPFKPMPTMTRHFLLMRHAKSSWNNANQSDFDRPLNERGKQTAPEMARLLADEGYVPDFVWCSTACRARETLQLALPVWPVSPVVSLDDQLYLASSETFWSFLQRTPDAVRNVMLVGHNPGLEELVNELHADAGEFPTAAAALFVLDDGVVFSQLHRESVALVKLWRPKEDLNESEN